MKKVWSEIKYWFFILLFLAILFELVASMILFRKYTAGKLAMLHFAGEMFSKGAGEKMYTIHSVARPGSSHNTVKAIADDAAAAYRFRYEPWLMFRVDDFQSNNVNISGFERRSVPAIAGNSTADTLDVYFFGGETMYGDQLSDSETIPSQFLKAWHKENPKKAVRVRNYGVPHYYSKQELMLLTSLLFEGHRPAIVIFLDGLNDFEKGRMLYYDRPYFSYALEQTFEGKMFQTGKNTFTDTTGALTQNVTGATPSYDFALATRYLNNIRMAQSICRKAGAKPYFFCQPAYADQQHSHQGRIKNVYPILQQTQDSTANIHFLKNVPVERAGFPGYSPQTAADIANEILNTVKTDLQ